uniref:Uncharacterized protein n=1 Tax=Melopsittacus undulatus TaxID=13146 RepID=A0A8V5FZN7_MELUD
MVVPFFLRSDCILQKSGFLLRRSPMRKANIYPRQKKGSIEIEKIQCVETVNLEEAPPPARQYPFQTVYVENAPDRLSIVTTEKLKAVFIVAS